MKKWFKDKIYWWNERPVIDGWTCIERVAIEVYENTDRLLDRKIYYVRTSKSHASGDRSILIVRLREIFPGIF